MNRRTALALFALTATGGAAALWLNDLGQLGSIRTRHGTLVPRDRVRHEAPDMSQLAAGTQVVGYKVGASIAKGWASGYGYPGDPTGGGSIGYKGQKLYSTKDFFAGKSKYVSVALKPDLMDSLWTPGNYELKNAPILFSPALDLRYTKELQKLGLTHLPLLAMDIGPGVGRHQIDVYVGSKTEAFSLPGTPLVDADIFVKVPATP